MALTDIQLRKSRPRTKPYELTDGAGLVAEVMPSGTVAWRYRYRLNGRREKVTIGKYPAISLAKARAKAMQFAVLVGDARSPMREKKAATLAAKTPQILEDFAKMWLVDVVEKTRKDPKQIRRYLEREVFPAIGHKRLSDVTPVDVLAITDRIKARGSEQAALVVRNVVKRLFAYAIARQVADSNPAAAIQARYIATARSRNRVLTRDEIGDVMRMIYRSSMRTANKLALHLLLITMVRKTELTEARWEHVNREHSEWHIPETKSGKPLIVYLSEQAKWLFEELQAMAGDSPYVLPSRSSPKKPIAASTLNHALEALGITRSRGFVIHDLRRTASTHLHEAGFPSDVIEKALNHAIGGVRGVYNRAEYAEQRRLMLQQWADMVEQWMQGAEVRTIGAAKG
ncbi:MAG: tyrosine-type recombinase/integrase [Gammaproteobacteria bacterium]|nr:tyrosine-type recombinase/integrase [Gammaproteobacteria bacterium]